MSATGSGGIGAAVRRAVRAVRGAGRAVRPLLSIQQRSPTALVGTVWVGGGHEPRPGAVLLDQRGRIDAIHPSTRWLPEGTRIVGGRGSWIGPALIDTHVHLAFDAAEEMLRSGVFAVRDLGAPFDKLADLRRSAARARLTATFSGPIITAVDGYPTTTWGIDGFGLQVPSVEYAAPAVDKLAEHDVAVVKVALEDADDLPALDPSSLRAVVRRAHELGLPVVAHALSRAMVRRAIEAEVDELAHVPTERLDDALIERLAERSIRVSSSLQTLFAEGRGADAARNARAMVRTGVPLMYGTDLGNTATSPGADPRELDRLAQAGLGRLGALRAATFEAGRAAGISASGMLRGGELINAVVLGEDPLIEPAAWNRPAAVFAAGRRLH